MGASLTIGEFSRLTHVTVKALRHYHDVDLLRPAAIDTANGYRLYSTDQVATAQVIRRFRELDMPLEEIRDVLHASDLLQRNRAILAHLDRLERRLDQTQADVASLRSLLADPAIPPAVEYRTAAATPSFAIAEMVPKAGIDEWCAAVFAELYAALDRADVRPTGPSGGLYSNDFFEDAAGAVTAFIPIGDRVEPRFGRVQLVEVPSSRLAVTLHVGSFNDLDRTYGALGAHVAERSLGSEGPIREHYLISPADTDDLARLRTEVCWPISPVLDTNYLLEGNRPWISE
jgi:DNA-binding transcriptional MerR regulator/effector-binding domain-containing protein